MNTVNNIIKMIVLIGAISFGTFVDARTLITGNDADSTTETFSTAVGVAAFGQGNGFTLVTGAGAATAGNTFAVAQVSRGQNAFTPLAPETLIGGDANPLYGAKINFLSLFEKLGAVAPVVVKDGEIKVRVFSTVEVVGDTDKEANVALLSSNDLKDTAGVATNAIVALQSGKLQNFTSKVLTKSGERILVGPQIFDDEFIMAPVKAAAGGTFGAGTSGISLLQVVDEITQIPKEDQTLDAEGKPIRTEESIVRVQINNSGNAFAFNGTLDAIKVSATATLLGDIVDIHFSTRLGRAYIAYSATPGAGGARSVVVARLEEDALVFEKLIPNSAVTSTDLIVGTSDTTAITAYKVRTMTTSAELDYLLVAGGNGAVTAVGNTIYCMPLVNDLPGKTASQQKSIIVSSTQGTLAQFDQTPQIVGVSGKFGHDFFADRKMSIPATAASDLLTNSSQAAIVGSGALPIPATAQVADIYMVNDSVFASINESYGATSEPGLYETQAILDQLGRIAAWTPWKRVGGGDDEIFSGTLDQQGQGTNGFGPTFMSVMNDSSGDAKIVRRTDWGQDNGDGLFGGTAGGTGADGLLMQIANTFSLRDGGPQTLVDFGFDNGETNKIGLMVVAGTGKIMVVQTGQDNGTNVTPFKGDYTVDERSSSDDSFPAVTNDTRIATITGPNITGIGPITSSTIARDTADGSGNNWLVVAGPKGISILAKSDGTSWTGELSTFSTLDTTFSFRAFTNELPFIKKVVASQDYLWILTKNTVERVSLSSAMVGSGTLTLTTVATAETVFDINTTFTDLIVTGPLALIASSRGVFRTGDGANVRTAADADAVLWTQVTFREPIGPVTQFAPLSNSAFTEDLGGRGQVYLLDAYNGYEQARSRRIYINIPGYDTLATTVSSSSVQLVDDQIWQVGNVTYFVDFGQMRNFCIPDGGVWFHARSTSSRHRLALFILPPDKIWRRAFTTARPFGSTSIAFEPAAGTTIRPIVRSAIMGSWLLPGDFGVRVSE